MGENDIYLLKYCARKEKEEATNERPQKVRCAFVGVELLARKSKQLAIGQRKNLDLLSLC